jgi:hypothetical protein
MTEQRIVFAIALTAALAVAVGCGKKAEEDAGGGSSDGTGASNPDIPAPPRASGPITANWDRTEIADAKRETTGNLRQIGLAVHSYHDSNGHLPAGIYDSSGKKLGLSWRVLILPYVEQGPLYKEFKLDEPWDSEHNKKLVRKMPKVFAPPGGTTISTGYTYYRTFSGEGALGYYPQASGKPGMVVRGTSLFSITDGTSNTILAAEVADPVIWTRPDELDYDAKKPVPKFGGVFEGGFYVVMCDGEVRFVKMPQPEPTLRALITRSGGEVAFLSEPSSSRPPPSTAPIKPAGPPYKGSSTRK